MHRVFGEWLRRSRRRTYARKQLCIAHQLLETMGIMRFANRARSGLLATGETGCKRSLTAGVVELTAPECQIGTSRAKVVVG